MHLLLSLFDAGARSIFTLLYSWFHSLSSPVAAHLPHNHHALSAFSFSNVNQRVVGSSPTGGAFLLHCNGLQELTVGFDADQ